MTLRKLSPKAQSGYSHAIKNFPRFFGQLCGVTHEEHTLEIVADSHLERLDRSFTQA